ncbi:MAG: hypothetical protein RLZZ490_1573 [Cyanobacteriota bacterium]|jgi:hypothetical protein
MHKNRQNRFKNLPPENKILMYRQAREPSLNPKSLELPFDGKRSGGNHWVIMSNIIPWSEFEGEYAQNFSKKVAEPPSLGLVNFLQFLKKGCR